MPVQQWFYKLPLRLRSLFKRRKLENDLDDELQFHVEQLMLANQSNGMSAEDAKSAALRAMEGLEQQKENCRDARGINWIENLSRDMQYASRMLRKSPAFTIVAILSLALGIGANSAIFSLIDTLLLRPLRVPRPAQLRTLYLQRGRPGPQYALTYPLFQSLSNHNSTFSGLFCWSGHRFQMKSGSEMVHVDGTLASGDYFRTLGVPALAGRVFTADDDHSTGGKDGPVAVISEDFWNRQFQRNPSAMGSPLVLDNVQFTIVGVMPRSFFGADVDAKPGIWVPLAMASRVDDPVCMASRSCWWLVAMGRIKEGISAKQANAALRTMSTSVLRETSPQKWNPADLRNYLSGAIGSSDGENGWSLLRLQFSNPLGILMGLVVLVLLIACANLANLLQARSMVRQREIGVRMAMGAGRGRVIRQLLTESALLSLLGATTGCLFALWLTRVLTAFLETSGRSWSGVAISLKLQPDWRIALFTLTLALATGLLFGLAPALRATHQGIGAVLKETSNSLRGRSHLTLDRFTFCVQAAISVVLVAAAGLFAGSLHRLFTLNTGFDPDHLVTIGVNTDKRADKDAALLNLYTQLLKRVQALPGVKAASLLWMMPLTNGGWDDYLNVPGRTDLTEAQRDTYANTIGPSFFDAMRIPLLSGRQFKQGDVAGSEKVAIINQLAARRFFPDGNPIGKEVSFGGASRRIVGVAGNIKYLNMREPDPPEIYIPFTQFDGRIPSLTFAIRSDLDVSSIYSAFRSVTHNLAPDVPIGRVKPMDEQLAESLGRERLMASLSVFLGSLALLLTAIGLHGSLAYAVTRRTGEIGIRMALGAQRANVLWFILSGTVGFVAIGIVIGTASVLGLSKLAGDLLYGIKPDDPGNLSMSILALLFIAVVAAAAPALRALKLDPTQALREE